jgi:D-3-phosphoglycerate dehydrogenase
MVDLAGKSLLVVGYGRIGTRVARYGQALGMKVSVLDPFWRPSRLAAEGVSPARDLHAALAEADVVSLHCPLRPDTRHLMNAAAFAALKPGAIVVNTARGPVVDEVALLAALNAGRLHGFGADVLEVEPPAGPHPLFAHPNVLLSPHNAASTEEGLARMDISGPASIMKLVQTEQEVAKYEFLVQLMGQRGMSWEGDEFTADEHDICRLWLLSKTYVISGGSSEIQLNIIAKRVLGLPG